ncbi:hypothetical protein DFA_04395 [Cavenderia fasciculata]|uniref:Ankyrin repeat-containing protein n=1 Tax=Cavenderia fasciculata TaxID=261658 RepID=F4PPG4_CACFS|nr:uncharacterized protein DFA_04395 [Cavenderia fasciculata]EGG22277.1 hypothetical protein DFA_04395 [Cavenderia fasciculata]|eukprot:XP_004360128.1 hypothetical protein DFA_04395 [Cavenderia fasciculata]
MTTNTTTTTTFQSIFRVKYIRDLIFNHVYNTTKQLCRWRSLKGRDMIKLPLPEMISKYAMPWDFQSHYLPKDCNEILLDKRKRAITLYCCHPNATLDTLNHLLEWSPGVGFDWEYLENNGYCLTVRDEKILEYMVSKCPRKNYYFDWAMEQACKHGHLSIVKLICSTFKSLHIKSVAMDTACSKGFIDIVKYLLDNRTEQWGEASMDRAANNNHLDIVKLLHFHKSRAIGCTFEALDGAALNGYIEIVKFLHFNRTEGASINAMNWAAENGYIEIVQFLHEHRSEGASTMAMDKAAENGHIEIVKYLSEHRSEGAKNAMNWAARNSHIEIVKYLYLNRTEGYSPLILSYVAARGNIELASYLVNTVKVECETFTLIESLERGHIDMFHFLYHHFKEQSKIWTPQVMDIAAKNGYIDIVKLLHSNRTEGASTNAMDWAALNGYIETVQFLHFNRTEGATAGAMDGAAQNGHTYVVQFLHEHRSEGATTNAMDWAAGYNHIETVKYLHLNRTEGATVNAMDRTTSVEIVKVLKERYDEAVKLVLPQFVGPTGIESIQSILKQTKKSEHLNQVRQLLKNHLLDHQVQESTKKKVFLVIMNTTTTTTTNTMNTTTTTTTTNTMNTTTTTTNTFHCIFRAKYIRDLVFNHINDLTKQLDGGDGRKQRSLKGRDIIKLPLFGMISRYAMPWHFVRHYLPTDCNQILLERRIRMINEYYYHPNATSDTLDHLFAHLLGRSHGVFELDWEYLQDNGYRLGIRDEKKLEYIVTKCPQKNYIFDWAMEQACKYNHLSIVKLICSNFKGVQLKEIGMYIACSKGFTDIVKYILDNRTEQWGEDAMDAAIQNGHLEVVKVIFFDKINGGGTRNALNYAADHGYLEIVKFLHENSDKGCSCYAMDHAAENGHYEIVKFLSEHRTEGASTNAMDGAAKNGHFEIVKYLSEYRSEGAYRAMDLAAENGHLEILKYLHFNRSEGATAMAMDWAAQNRHIDIVKYLCEHRTEGCVRSLEYAARNGDIEMVLYLINNLKVRCFNFTLKEVLDKGRLDIFQILYDHYKEKSDIWTKDIMDCAAKNGYIDIVKLLHFNRTEGPSRGAMVGAAAMGHFDVVKFLHEHRTEGATRVAIDYASQNGHIDIVKYLYQHRSEGGTTDAMDLAAGNGHYEIVKYLHEHRSEGATTTAMNRAARNGYIDVVKFLSEHRTEGATTDAMDLAAQNGHIEIVQLALTQFVVNSTDTMSSIESLTRVIKQMKNSDHFEVYQLLEDHFKQLQQKHQHAIAGKGLLGQFKKVKYIRELVFNHVTSHSKGRSLKGRDIINLPRLGMISIYAMPWEFICHYLPSDCNQILLDRRKRVISQYCHHPNSTLDTLQHLFEWSAIVDFDWEYLKRWSLWSFRKRYIGIYHQEMSDRG